MTELDVDRIRRELGAKRVGCEIHYHRSLPSTMDEARLLAERGVPEGAVVVAEEQSQGRGRFQREWVSPPGLNLAFSVLFRPVTHHLPSLNMAAALAVGDAVRNLSGLSTGIKWPNDVQIEGKKLSGILVETAIEGGEAIHAVVGIGLNVNLDPRDHPQIEGTATSMLAASGRLFERTAVLISLLRHLDRYYSEIRAGASLTEAWTDRIETLGRCVEVRWKDDLIDGVADAVDDQGNLILKRPDGSRMTVVAGEVTLRV